MKKPLLFTAMIFCLAVPGLSWANALMPSLPWSVYLYEGGRLLALLAFVLMFFQFVLSARIPWLERGLGPGTLFKLHRRWGLIAFVLILSHPALLLLSERLQGYASAMSPIKILGAFTLVVLCAAVLAALLSRRLHLKVQTWKRVHKATYVVFPLGFVHSLLIGTTLQKGPARVLWLILGAGYVVILGYKVLRGSPVKHPS
ncbi:MAG: ferric reductase-like transmembrane domain-containing protein [Deltaproteobacteria bacterium]|nr:ferric reductase-like transmembrane domain-containing protein [Deltaproteobacteria bacterium]